MAEKKSFNRLALDLVPQNYYLELQPDLEAFTFKGKEVITVNVKKETSEVTLNCVDIKISSVVSIAGGNDIAISEISYCKEEETVTLKFVSPLPLGSAEIHLEYVGELNDKMKGFYRSKYEVDGKDRYCAVTQFEATDARRAFICWDEPAVKATFDIKLVVPKSKVALSNMNITEENPHSTDGTLKEVTFARTPIMSTYLLAFIVGDFDYVEDTSSDGVLVRVYTPINKKEQGDFALHVAVKTLPFYKDYFGIAYPLPKMDLIAIPDFAAGAMENWGLVTYRETALLVDPKNSSSSAKQWVALVVGHEIAHQWFGNLVTMEWWTHLWLNEGFASWIEYLCVDHCFPEYDIWTQFVTSDYTRALNLDALKNSHPIEVPVKNPDEIDEIFDLISYSKGASVIRMLHDYIGDKDFKTGMNQYLNKFKYLNAATEDLWESLEKSSSKPIGRIMTAWTKQMGFPLLKVSSEQKDSSRVLTISQTKFIADQSKDEEGSLWEVPVSIVTSDNPSEVCHKFVLSKASDTVTLENLPAEKWVKLNPGAVGFYRTHYSTEMLDALLPSIKDGSLPPRDRLNLESDLFALAKAGAASTVEALRVMEAFESEMNYTVWCDIASNLGSLATLIAFTDYSTRLQTFVNKLFLQSYERLGWEKKKEEGHLDALLRSLVIRIMGRNGHQPAVEEARKRFKEHIADVSVLPADLRAPVYNTVLVHGGAEDFEAMLDLFNKQELHEERERIMRSLGAVKDPQLIKKVLEFAMSDKVRSQDTVFVIVGVTGSKTGRELAWEFLKENWSEMITRYAGGFLLSRLVKCTTEGFVTEEKAQEIEAFFREHSAPAAERTIKQSLENIRLHASWLKRDGAAIEAWLKSKTE
ncbi:puromycin-sensitive aminopeptidase-like [Anneissia japonica]|uniref:puromycin-sensitive aminopeptidase-like n=1 Tax=Anneissia japonica TaxID=1529436 RepID=UPI0014257C17|nr:puromycin-sensitive aminopeptidase-like [Anneissia japonica]